MAIYSAELRNINKILNQLPQSIKIILVIVFVILFGIFFIGIAYLAATKWVSLGMDEANRTIGSVGNSNPEYFTLVGVYVNTVFTLILCIFAMLSGFYACCSYFQSKKEQRIKYLEKGLENFYIPAINALENNSCTNDEMKQFFCKYWQYSYLADKEVYSLFTEYRKKIAKHPNNQNSNNADCDIFDELLNKVKEDIDKHQRELREQRK